MALELNRVVAEILERSPRRGPPIVIAPAILSAAALEVHDYQTGVTSEADEKTIAAALVDANVQLTGVGGVPMGAPMAPLALTAAMLQLAALTPPVAVPLDVVDAARTEQHLAMYNVVAGTPLQTQSIAAAYGKVMGLLTTAGVKPVGATGATGPARGAAGTTGTTGATAATGATGPASTVMQPAPTAPTLAAAVAQAAAAGVPQPMSPAVKTALDLEAGLARTGTAPTVEQQHQLAEAHAEVKAALPK